MMVKIDITANNLSEKNRVIATYAGVLNGFFIKNGFYPLPGVGVLNKVETVVLPNLDYSKLDIKLINKAEKSRDIDFACLNKPLIYASLLNNLNLNIRTFSTTTDLSPDYIKEITKNLKSTILKFTQNFSYLSNKNFNIKIFITKYGTLGSFNSLSQKDLEDSEIDLLFYLRKDMPAYYVCELFLSSVTYNLVHSYSTNWQNGEAVSDFLTKYFLNLPEFVPTLEATEKNNKSLLTRSIKYLHSLNISANSVLEYDESTQKIYLRNKEISNMFSSYEHKVLSHLVKNKGNIITFDDIAKVLYGDSAEVNFSLWGINKCIQRIRGKLEKTGLPKSIIKNVKGVGFIF